MRSPLLILISFCALALLLAGEGQAAAHQDPPSPSPPDINPRPTPIDVVPFTEIPEEDILIFAVYIDNFILHQGIILYKRDDRFFISLSGITEALEFPITVDVNAATADGWFLNNDRLFKLDLAAKNVIIQGKTMPFGADRVHRVTDDIYVETSELTKWFPVFYEIDFQNLAINLTAQEPLPLQERMARENRRKRLFRPGSISNEYEEGKRSDPLFSTPFADISLSAERRPTGGTEGGPLFSSQYSLNSAGIILGQDTNLNIFTNGGQGGPTFRLSTGRKSADRSLLGGLGLREYALGDIDTPTIPLVSNSVTGRGLVLSTFELNRSTDAKQANLRGELPAGWEVELYRNAVLLDYLTENRNGQYEFLNIETLPGLNIFKLVFYGPQGQKYEKIERVLNDSNVINKGTTNYRVVVNQQNQNLIGTDQTLSAFSNRDQKELRLQLVGEHGLTENLTVTASLSSLSIDGIRRGFYQTGLHSSLGAFPVSVNAALDDNGGFALSARTQKSFGRFSVTGEHIRYSNYLSETSGTSVLGGDLLSSSDISLNGFLPLFPSYRIPFNLRARYQENDDGRNVFSLSSRLSKRIKRFNVTLSTDWRSGTDLPSQLGGNFLVSSKFGKALLRAIVNYELKPDISLNSINLSSSWQLGATSGLRASLNYQNSARGLASLSFGYNKRFENFILSVTSNIDSEGQIFAGFGLSFSLGLTPRNNDLYFSNRSLTSTGIAAPRVFLDRDNNNVFNDGDELLSGVTFASNQSIQFKKTDKAGQTLVTGLPLYRGTNLAVKEESLQNPFLISVKKGINFKLRPGSPYQLDFPVVEAGEIDGTLTIQAGGRQKPAAGFTIYLRSADGAVIAQQTSAFDGFYIFDRIIPGSYTLELDMQETSALGYGKPAGRPVTLSAEDNIIIGIDYLLTPGGKPLEQQPAPSAQPVVTAANTITAQPTIPRQPQVTTQAQYGLHLLSFLHRRSVQPGWAAIHRSYPNILEGKALKLSSVTVGDKRYLRLIAGPYSTRAQAKQACQALLKDNIYCNVKPFEGQSWTPITQINLE